ncbi:MAG: glycine cleavage system protein H [Nitrospiraceae bacterium]|jgi:glycine cleavage system H protein|nr:glycine cleavage system protein H [Nitrospiraceae bacterium]|tara:strand:- start:652 stop:1044 length:393 start_codon:yes stop_codon:yes gene_type:complete
MFPDTFLYTKDHEWVNVDDGGGCIVGVSQFAQESLGDIVYVEFPAVGAKVHRGDEIGELESTKATSPIYSPVNGTILRINDQLIARPDLVNNDPYGEGWIVSIMLETQEELDQLMDAKAYEAFVRGEGDD